MVAGKKDNTEVSDLQRALEESEIQLKAVIDTAVDGIITMDKKAIVRSINPAGAEIFGYDPEEVIGKNIKMLMPEPDKSGHDQYVRNYQKSGEKKIIGIGREVRGLKKNGETFPFRLAVSEVKLSDGVLYTGIIHDISDQKKAEQDLKALNDELEDKVGERTDELSKALADLQRVNEDLMTEVKKRQRAEKEAKVALEKEMELGELKSRFVSMASHEFRTPLGGILSSISLIARYNSEDQVDKRLKHVGRVKKAVQGLTAILNDFLSLDKLQQGKITLRPQKFNLKLFISEVVEEMELVKKPGQEISYIHTGHDGDVELDTNTFKNILLNLLSNAVKYSHENDRVELTSDLSDEKIILIVKDEGIGIPEEDKKHMFERFFRAKNALNLQGTGLGLNIVKKYLDLMGGTIDLESKEGEGSTFTIEIPQNKTA